MHTSSESAKTLEKQQYDHRCILRIAEHRETPFDVLLNNFRLLSGNEIYASAVAVKKISLPMFQTLSSSIDLIINNTNESDAMFEDCLESVRTMLRVDDENGKFWRHAAQAIYLKFKFSQRNLHATVQDKLERKFVDLHSSVREIFVSRLEGIVKSNSCAQAFLKKDDLVNLFAMGDHKTLKKYVIFDSILDEARLSATSQWLNEFENANMNKYHEIIKNQGISFRYTEHSEAVPDEVVNAPLVCLPESNSLTRAQCLLKQWNLPSDIGSQETLITPLNPSTEQAMKPRAEYVARVSWGVEWTTYNRTHFDANSPPPAVEKGYKIDVYYPKLSKNEKVRFQKFPSKNGWEDFTCFLRIYVENGYSDLTFVIRNAPINTNPHQGYLCEFKNDVFSLHFTLKPLRYKRI